MKRDPKTNPDQEVRSQNARAGTPGVNGNGSTPVTMEMIPAPDPHGAAANDPTLQRRALLAAFRRRWLLSSSLGLLVGLAVACVIWLVMPAPFVAFSELQIKAVQEKLLFSTAEQEARFETYKQTQMMRVKSPFVLNAALRSPDVANLSIVQEQEYPVDWLEQELSVSSPAAEFLRISLAGEKPRELAALVNAITNAYLDEVVNEEHKRRRERLADLQKIHREMEEELRQKYAALKRLVESLNGSQPASVQLRQQLEIEYFAELRKQLAQVMYEAKMAKIELEVRKAGAGEAKAPDIPDAVLDAYLAKEPEYAAAASRVAQLEQLMERFRKTVREGHPTLVAYEREVERARQDLDKLTKELRPRLAERLREEFSRQSEATVAQLEERIRLLELEREHLEKEVETQKIEQKRAGLLSFDLETLQKDIANVERISTQVQDEIKKLEIEIQSPPRIALHRAAEAPRRREMKKKYAATALGGFGSFGLIVAAIVLLEYRSRRISSLDEVVDSLNLRVMGAVPHLPRWVTNGKRSAKRSRTTFWHSVLTESIDSTRTLLLRDASLESLNLVMVASAMGGEGKTTLACHLATSLARAGRKTLLIDADMRRPSVQRVFGLPLSPGLCEVLRGEAQLEDALQETNAAGLTVLPAGKINQDTLQRLAKDGLGDVLAAARNQFDMVIVDSSPVLPVTDALLVAQYVDAVIFSIRRDVSRVAKVSAACQRLSMLGVPILGAVVIGLDDGSYAQRYPHYRYGYGYGYPGYGYGYRQSYNATPVPH